MIRINLLPVRQIKKRIKSRNELIGLLIGLLVLLLGLATVAYSQIQRIEEIHANIDNLNKEKTKYAAIIKQIKEIEKTKKVLEMKQDVIKNLQVSSQIPVRIMDEVANLTPSTRVWLKSLRLQAGSLVISGVALDNETIAKFMTDFMQSPFFAKAELQNSSMINVSGQRLKSFALNIVIEKPVNQVDNKPKK